MAETFDTYNHQYLNDPSGELFNSALITRYSQEAESTFACDHPCIVRRVALTIVAGTSIYSLRDDVASIRRVTWKGYKLDPLPQRNFREVFQSGTQSGQPFWYIFNNIGLNQIQLFPSPTENVSSITTNLYGSEIPNRVIVEYWQLPNYSTFIIPLYLRRRLLKAYVLRGCFNVEGPGQNLKNAAYFKKKYQYLSDRYGLLLNYFMNKPKKLVVNGISGSNYFPGKPMLPISRYGTSVDIGE